MMLAAVKTLLGIETDDQDAVLQIMIDDAKAAGKIIRSSWIMWSGNW